MVYKCFCDYTFKIIEFFLNSISFATELFLHNSTKCFILDSKIKLNLITTMGFIIYLFIFNLL